MEFQQEPNRFFKEDVNGKLVAEIVFPTVDENTYSIEHTFVHDDYRGQGIAAQLVAAVVDLARQENKQIIPLCTYAHAAFQKHPEYHDVLK